MYDALLALLLSGTAAAFRDPSVKSSGPVETSGEGWVYPMPRLRDGRSPVISDGWGSNRDGGSRSHRGVDVMYQRPHNVTSAVYQADHGSKMFEVPAGTPVLAAHDGTFWSAGSTSRGIGVILSHGKPWAAFYQHLQELSVEVSHMKRGDPIKAGQVIGICGYSHMDGAQIRHLHFELWHGGGHEAAIDPAPIMRPWPKIGPL